MEDFPLVIGFIDLGTTDRGYESLEKIIISAIRQWNYKRELLRKIAHPYRGNFVSGSDEKLIMMEKKLDKFIADMKSILETDAYISDCRKLINLLRTLVDNLTIYHNSFIQAGLPRAVLPTALDKESFKTVFFRAHTLSDKLARELLEAIYPHLITDSGYWVG